MPSVVRHGPGSSRQLKVGYRKIHLKSCKSQSPSWHRRAECGANWNDCHRYAFDQDLSASCLNINSPFWWPEFANYSVNSTSFAVDLVAANTSTNSSSPASTSDYSTVSATSDSTATANGASGALYSGQTANHPIASGGFTTVNQGQTARPSQGAALQNIPPVLPLCLALFLALFVWI